MPRTMRIFIMGVNHPVPTFIRRRLARLDAAGIQLVIACHKKKDFADFKNAELIEFKKVSTQNPFRLILQFIALIFRFPSNFRLWRLATQPSFLSRLKWCMEVIQMSRIPAIDLIHLQWLVPEERYQWLVPFYKKIPIVISVRGSQVTVHATVGHQDFIRENFTQASALHCVSNDIARQCIHLGADGRKVFVNYNGINLQNFKPASVGKGVSDTFNLVSVGSLIWRKGYIFQLLIVKKLIEMGHSPHLTIVGSGVEDKSLRYTAHRLGLDRAITFKGQLKEPDIIQLLQSSDLYLSTSAAEGLPNSLVEAAACGLPIVSFECEGAREVIEDEKTGFVVSFGQVENATEKIALLIQDEKLRNELSLRSRQKMEREFNENEWVTEMISVYEKLADGKPIG